MKTNLTAKTEKKFTQQNGRWYPVDGDTIDMRGTGFSSEKEVREWLAARQENGLDAGLVVKFSK